MNIIKMSLITFIMRQSILLIFLSK